MMHDMYGIIKVTEVSYFSSRKYLLVAETRFGGILTFSMPFAGGCNFLRIGLW